jgi:hypothetical protein
MLKRFFIGSVLALGFAAAITAKASAAAPKLDLEITNETGHTVVAFFFKDGVAHYNEKGGTQFGVIEDGHSAVAHAPNCNFSIMLIDHEDIWHAEFHDCDSTHYVFHKDTGHDKKK